MTRAKVLASSLLAAAFSFVMSGSACTDSSGSGAGAAGGSGGTGGAGCSNIENVGETVTQVQADGPAPTPLGGAIADGTYVLTKNEAYPPVSAAIPAHGRETLEIAGTIMNAALVTDDNPAGLQGTTMLTTSGTQLTITWLCGATGSFDQGYTATATELVLIAPPGAVQTYTKH